jgi:hypothetical protein
MNRIFAILFSISTATHAETFYVNGSNPSAKDTNSGTIDSPWLTIQHGVDQAKPGDIVVVLPGSYGRTSIKKSGVKDKWIVVKGSVIPNQDHVDQSQMLNPTNPVAFLGNPAVNAVSQGFDINGASFVRVENFEITAVGSGKGGIFLKQSDHIEIIKNFLHDLNPTSLNHGGIRCDSPDVSNVLVAANTLFRCAGCSIQTGGSNWIVEGNEASHGSNINTATGEFVGGEDAMRIFGTGHIIRNNYFHDFYESESDPTRAPPHLDAFQTFSIYPDTQYASDILIESNYCVNICQMFMGSDTDEAKSGISRVHNITIRNNVFRGARAVALIIGRGCDNFTVVNNVISESGYSAITVSENSHHATVLNNIFYNTCRISAAKGSATGPASIDATSMPGSVVDYNLCNYRYTYPVKIADYDNNSLFGVDPKFVNPGTGDYRLTAESPAIGSGTLINDKKQDIGAFQFGTADGAWLLKHLQPAQGTNSNLMPAN